MTEHLNFSADRPAGVDSVDYLGTDALALRLRTILRDPSLKDGFVIGVEGRWGSGKSTLIKKTVGHLTALEEATIIVQFNPWLVGDKRDLIAEFFVGLNQALAQYALKKGLKGNAKRTVEHATEALKKYSKHLATGAQFLSAASVILPHLQPLAKILDETASGLSDAFTSKSLHEQKLEIEKALRSFKDPIVVFIDDTERLDPPEVMEILRLLRAVGDLPNVIYVVCYDRKALVRSIGIALAGNGHDETGEAYLEKIVQATVTIPRPEEFALRRWFLRDAQVIFGPQADETDRRLREVVDFHGGFTLETPRDVVRALNSLKLVWPIVGDFVDVPDLVWLHLIKLKRPQLFDWVESYLNGFAEVARGTASASDGIEQATKLFDIIEPDYPKDGINLYRLLDIVPGLERVRNDNGLGGWSAFKIDRDKIDMHTRGRRLGSPHYYRYYFALGQNSGFIPAPELIEAQTELFAKSNKFVQRLTSAAEQRFEDGELRSTILLDSIRSIVPRLDQTQSQFLFETIANTTDTAIRNTPDPFFNGRRTIWTPLGVWQEIISQDSKRKLWISDLIESGMSVCFLAFFIRYILRQSAYEFNLTNEEETRLAKQFAERISCLGNSLWEQPHPEFVFRVALQYSEPETKTRRKLEEFYADDFNLIRLIGQEEVRGRVIDSTRNLLRPLNLKEIAEIWKDDELPQRITRIVQNRDSFPMELQQHLDIILSGLADYETANKMRSG